MAARTECHSPDAPSSGGAGAEKEFHVKHSKSAAERQHDRDNRMRALGRVQRKIWIHNEDWPDLRDEIDRLNAKRETDEMSASSYRIVMPDGKVFTRVSSSANYQTKHEGQDNAHRTDTSIFHRARRGIERALWRMQSKS